MPDIEALLHPYGFTESYTVEGREAIANLFPVEKRCGIYVLHFADGRYYVGQSIDVTRRYVEHRQNHPDIRKLSFHCFPEVDLSSIEDELIRLLQHQGLHLRNSRGIIPLAGEADFDLLMTVSEQQAWLNDVQTADLSGSRIVDADLRNRTTAKYVKLRQKPQFSDFIAVAQEYVRTAIPRARASEVSFWSCSCLPKSHIYSRISINWQEVFSVIVNPEELAFSFHLAASPLPFGAKLQEYFGRFPGIGIQLALEEEYIAAFPGQYANEKDIQEYFTDDMLQLPDDLEAQLVEWIKVAPTLCFADHAYRPGGPDQINILVAGREDALKLLGIEAFRRSIRRTNLHLMRLGPSPYRGSHCLDLADDLLTGEKN